VDYLRALDLERIQRVLSKEGGILIDLRPVDDYLARHIPRSIPLLFESGPGLGGRARDLLPLDARLVLLEDDVSDLTESVDSFRGKGFEVAGYLEGGVDGWPDGDLAATPAIQLDEWKKGPLLNVNDPGTIPPDGALPIPTERLWQRYQEIPAGAIGVLAGWGVRAAAAVGILEFLGLRELTFVRTRPPAAKPPMAGPEVFRVGE
jgi:rhodanese-related sulfurtransferase